MKPKILITRKIFPETIEFLKKHVEVEIGTHRKDLPREVLLQKITDKEGLLTLLLETIDREIIDAASKLKIIANCAVGYNNIDVDYARKKGILVTNTPDVLTEATADLTWALILAVSRRIPEADRFVRKRKFKGWESSAWAGSEKL